MAQSIKTDLHKGSALFFQKEVFVYGLKDGGQQTKFCIYKLNDSLLITDSASYNISGSKHDYLRIQADTIHGLVNIYLQKTGQRQVSLIRYNTLLNLTAHEENIEITRLNSTDILGVSPYYETDRVYSIQRITDSSGVQFYLNCFKLQSRDKNFTYDPCWQFPFDRKNISEARIIYAGKQVLVFTKVGAGEKSGYWMLTIDAQKGELIRGTRISKKEDQSVYEAGAVLYDSIKQVVHLSGTFKTAKKELNIFYMQIDAYGNIGTKAISPIVITETPRGASKTRPEFVASVQKINLNPNRVDLEVDLYIREKNSCFNYCNTISVLFNMGSDGIVAVKSEAKSNRLLEDWISTGDVAKINGRWCADSTVATSPGKHEELTFPVKAGWKQEGKISYWLLKKTETGKGSISFAHTITENNKLKISSLGTIAKSLWPQLITLTNNRYLIVKDSKTGELELSAGSW